MIATALLFFAAAVSPDAPTVVTDEKGCRWIRPAAKPRPPAKASSGVPVRKARPKRVPHEPKPGDELIGCDEDGPVWTSDITTIEFWPPEAPPVKIGRIDPLEPSPAPPEQPQPEPPTFAEGCDCTGYLAPVWPSWGYAGGGGYISPAPPVPEPEVWLLFLAGLAVIIRRAT